MASSKLDVANGALLRLGAKPIASLSDPSDRGLACNAHLDETLDETLRDHPWNFATERVALTPTGTPTFGFAHAFALPADALRVLDIVGAPPYRVEGRNILCDTTPIQVRYVKRVTEPTLWDAAFVEAFELHLASKIAYNVTGQADLIVKFTELYAAKLRAARAVDDQEGEAAQYVDPGPVTVSQLLRDAVGRLFDYTFGHLTRLDSTEGNHAPDGKVMDGMASAKPEAIRLASLVFARSRDEVLRAHVWNFALKRVKSLAYTNPAATLTPGAGATTLGASVTFTATGAFTAQDVGRRIRNAIAAGQATVTSAAGAPNSVTATIDVPFVSLVPLAPAEWRYDFVPPVHTYLFSHPKPQDWLRWIGHVEGGSKPVWPGAKLRQRESRDVFKVEGQRVVADSDQLDLLYVSQVTDLTQWDTLALEVLIYSICSKIAYPITKSNTTAEAMMKMLGAKLSEARTTDAQEDVPDTFGSDILVSVRQ